MDDSDVLSKDLIKLHDIHGTVYTFKVEQTKKGYFFGMEFNQEE